MVRYVGCITIYLKIFPIFLDCNKKKKKQYMYQFFSKYGIKFQNIQILKKCITYIVSKITKKKSNTNDVDIPIPIKL